MKFLNSASQEIPRGSARKKHYRVVGVASNDTLNIRPQPGDLSTIRGRIPSDAAQVEMFECRQASGAKWCRIQYGGTTGWVNSQYLELAE